jgi:threonine synthase
MRYQSTRGNGGSKTFEEVLISTYASDGGMWVPEKLPEISSETLLSWTSLSFPEICAQIMHSFTDLDLLVLHQITAEALSTFNDGMKPLPMTQFNDLILLDCSLGPTFAFKDVGLQVVARLLNHVLGKQNKRANVVIDTSGDTGPAAIAYVTIFSFISSNLFLSDF